MQPRSICTTVDTNTCTSWLHDSLMMHSYNCIWKKRSVDTRHACRQARLQIYVCVLQSRGVTHTNGWRQFAIMTWDKVPSGPPPTPLAMLHRRMVQGQYSVWAHEDGGNWICACTHSKTLFTRKRPIPYADTLGMLAYYPCHSHALGIKSPENSMEIPKHPRQVVLP